MDKKPVRKYQDPKETYAQAARKNTEKAVELVRPHYYGKIDGVHVMHALHDDHQSLIGKHVHNADDSKLKETIEDAKSNGFATIVLHGAPPESLRTKIHHKMGPVATGKLLKSEVAPIRITVSVNVPDDWGWDEPLAKSKKAPKADEPYTPPKAITSRIHRQHDRELAVEGKSVKANPEEALGIAHWNKHDGTMSVITRGGIPAKLGIDPAIKSSGNHIFPHHLKINGPYKIVSHESGLHGDGGNPRTAIVARLKDMEFYHKDDMPATDDHVPAGLDIKGGALKVNGEHVVEGHGLILTSHRAPDTAQFTKDGKPVVKEKRIPKIHVKAGAQSKKLAASEAADWDKEIQSLYKSFLNDIEDGASDVQSRLQSLRDKVKGYLDELGLDADHEEESEDPKKDSTELEEKLKSHLHDDNIPDEVTVPGKDLVDGMVEPEEDCGACERPVKQCLCYSGLPKPRLEFDGKKVTIHFGKSEAWDQESRSAFLQDLKRRAGRILKRKFS